MDRRIAWFLAAAAVVALALPAGAQDDPLAKERDRLDLMAQKTTLLVERHLQNARAFEERLDLPGAEKELLAARDLDPTNRITLDYLGQIQSLMGLPEAQARSLAVSAAERYRAQQEQMRTFARQDLDRADKLLADGQYEQAAAITRTVMNQVRWAGPSVDWGDLPPRARATLERATRMAGGQSDAERRQKEAEAYSKLRSEDAESSRRDEQRIDLMLDAAYARFLDSDYDGAAELAEAVLREDPGNPMAHEIVDAARDSGREAAHAKYLRDRHEQMLKWRESMEAVRVPHNEIMTAPDKDHWAEITALRGTRNALGLAEPDPEETALRARLASTRMDADWQDLTIVQAANNIFLTTGIPVSVDPEVSSELDSAAEYVNLAGLRDLPVQSVLNILVETVGQDLAWTYRKGRVYITKKEKAAGKPIPRVHNIQDLTFPITDFKGANIRDIPLPGQAGDDNETTIFSSELDRVRLIEPDEVLNLVRENIARDSWDASDAYSIDFVDNQNLLVIHTPEVQQEVADFLDDLRSYSTSMVTLESRFFSLTDAFIEEIGADLRGLGPSGNLGDQFPLDAVDPSQTQGLDNNGDGTGNPNAGVFFDSQKKTVAATSENFFNNPLGNILSTVGGGAFQFTVLNDTQLNVVLTAIQKSRNATEISAPVVSVYNTQRAFVTVVNQVSFVQGYDVDVANAAFIADPNIGVVQEGIVLDVRPTISFDRKYVTLDVQTTVAALERPIREVTTNLGGQSTPVTFALPQLDVQDAQTTVVVPDRGSVVLGGFKHVLYKNRTAEAPWFADIPVLGFFFREKGLTDEMTDLIIVIRATISDWSELQATLAPEAVVRGRSAR